MIISRELITEKPEEVLLRYGKDILESSSFQSMKFYNHHKRSTTYAHCVAVTLKAIRFAKEHHIRVDIKALVRGSLLHDYYRYNHRTGERMKWHLLRHGYVAMINATRDFNIGPIEQDMIANHMWPLHPFRFPKTIEGWILIWADKVTAVKDRYTLAVKTKE